MSNQTAVDYEKQFQADLAKATALSLEQQALDEYNRTKKYGTVASNSRKSKTDDQLWQRYAKATSTPASAHSARLGGGHILQFPKPQQQRRHSDIPKHYSANVEPGTERSKTPPTAATAENDLINFSSCASSKETDKKTFENLIADLHKIHTTNSQTILMPLGPTAAAPIYLPYGQKPPRTMYVAPIATASVPSGAATAPISGVQLIPLHSTYHQQKVPLTNEELSKLYNMSLPHTNDFLGNRPIGLVPSPMGLKYGQANPALTAGTSSISYQPSIASFKYQNNRITSTALQKVNNSRNPLDAVTCSKMSTIPDTQKASQPLATTTAAPSRRFSTANAKQSSVDDLIDLTPVDDFHVSVLEVFDPLLNASEKEEDNDNASEATSYYAEYDPFDYLYSGGSTQYSDPVYEAVNKLDKCADNSNQSPVITVVWKRNHTENEPDPEEINAIEMPQNCKTFSSSLTPPPPPLPPRQIDYSSSSTRLVASQNNESHANDVLHNPANNQQGISKVLDRRKTCKRLYEIVSGQRTIDEELLDFFYMIKTLRQCYRYDDESTNVGHIVASEFNYHYPVDTSIKILVYPALNILTANADTLANCKAQFKGYGAPVVFTCDINTPVEIVIGQAFCCLEGQLQGSVNDYVVKPIGVLEWLSNTSKLSQLECVHNSLKLEKDVQLGLCLKTEENMKIIARMDTDDLNDMAIRPEDILPNETAASISYDSMMILIETLETEIDKLEISVNDYNSRIMLSCSGVVQAVKAICALLGSIDTMDIADCIHELKRICEHNQHKYIADCAVTGSTPEIGCDKGDYAMVCLRPSSLLEDVKLKCSQLRDAVQELIELYSNQFCVAFSVKSPDYSTSSINVSYVLKPLRVSVNCLHRPPPNWKYDSYFLGIQINYGTRFISDPMVARCSTDINSRSLFPRLTFSAWITFEKNSICTLPLEARLIFVLYGIQMAENDTNTNGENVEKNQITTELGWCAIQLFDFKREMICGSYLLSVWPPTADKFLGPAPARGCHPQPDICPVLSIEIPSYGSRIQFPEPLPKLPIAPRYDFSSLDSNLQQELLDTAEQGYTGAIDKREVLWEKRLYLQKVPHALPKVLHAAHSWDYASLMDLHSLLHSWSPLSPVQALELLLPRYPDAKVRSKAIEWISQFHNDQLVDYLPQLLQALKHDTYEASAMARFLLCKCLESPRIAHHMYCLLVHFLPGNDPQNSIDASSGINEINESLITQARYYRRNKLMLRALLAMCGEKLSKRLLLQNLMCKNLANIAENVKEAKEGLRQKVLLVGMDSVHQELLDKPTTLPLGPELVVTGINVRCCSYFNSNTLPLKISFIGPDKEVLPAIFKSGDDLQQDMLTIQLIRIMNKMWLADGLDLKIVTFDCVPTGYKKGMIELVSDAETLRKIQIEYGLTGPFKDRPIAEWLAKQNPSQLEYQRAVKNFTVSCAGYSVATYILGICDRHNDNIMLKTSGHLFHIDFGKFLGDAQMFGNFKRDRTPFVLTSDMAYVINGGDKPSINFHYFVDLCCHAFNIVRRHGDLLLHMLALMVTAGIPGVTADAVTYVRKALLPSQSNPEAAASFAKMIQFSLKSWFTQFNFFLHNLAQIRFAADEDSGELLSFVPRKYTLQEDGRLKSVMVVRCQKHYDMEKYYTYILRVTRHGQPDPIHLFRSYKEFTEFHQKLCLHYPLAKLHSLPSGMYVGRSNVKSVAEKRLPVIQKFLLSLFNSADEIAHSDLVYTFFHPLLRDQQEANLEMSKVRESSLQTRHNRHEEVGQLKLSLQYNREVLTVMIHHAKGLPLLQGGQEPNTYVKCYLKPDEKKTTKRKTKVVRRTCVPSYMETLEYRMPLDIIKRRTLHVTVWSHDTLQENELLGGFQIDLSNYNLYEELIDWFHLGYMSRH